MSKSVKFRNWEADVYVERYKNNGRIAIELIDPDDGEIIAVATINIPQVDLQKNEVIIKNYSENEGMYQALLKAGVIGPAKYYVESGFVTCPVCDCLLPVNETTL